MKIVVSRSLLAASILSTAFAAVPVYAFDSNGLDADTSGLQFHRGAGNAGAANVNGTAAPLDTQTHPIVAPTDSLRASFFDPAKRVLLNKGGNPENVRCLILSFIGEHFTKLDDAGYEQKIDQTIAGTEMYFVDYSCRDKLKKPASVAIAVPASSKKAINKICGVQFPDTDKDLMLLWASVQGESVQLPRHSVDPTIAAHEVMHLLLKNLSQSKTIENGGSVHHGLTNYLRWGVGTPTTEWKPSDPNKCKASTGGQSAQSGGSGESMMAGATSGSGSSAEEAPTNDDGIDDVIDLDSD
jgi:hypothetical protein